MSSARRRRSVRRSGSAARAAELCWTAGTALSGGTIVLHVVSRLPYAALHHVAGPYFEVFRPGGAAPAEGIHRERRRLRDLRLGTRPIYSSGLRVADHRELFERIYDPPAAVLERLPIGDVHYTSTSPTTARDLRDRIPALTLFDHLVHLAELSDAGRRRLRARLAGTALFTRSSRRPRVGRALLREIRASFYRELFLAFVPAVDLPVLMLALVIRAYFADLLRTDIQGEAARTAPVAQRVIEESARSCSRGPTASPGATT